mmetsp:Transcript_23725/g.67854  ORF Transcript_23725/g.67854 Transcript_23725/m.67854 type:complete len:412 (-) Transcript_23725:1-1236(-)
MDDQVPRQSPRGHGVLARLPRSRAALRLCCHGLLLLLLLGQAVHGVSGVGRHAGLSGADVLDVLPADDRGSEVAARPPVLRRHRPRHGRARVLHPAAVRPGVLPPLAANVGVAVVPACRHGIPCDVEEVVLVKGLNQANDLHSCRLLQDPNPPVHDPLRLNRRCAEGVWAPHVAMRAAMELRVETALSRIVHHLVDGARRLLAAVGIASLTPWHEHLVRAHAEARPAMGCVLEHGGAGAGVVEAPGDVLGPALQLLGHAVGGPGLLALLRIFTGKAWARHLRARCWSVRAVLGPRNAPLGEVVREDGVGGPEPARLRLLPVAEVRAARGVLAPPLASVVVHVNKLQSRVCRIPSVHIVAAVQDLRVVGKQLGRRVNRRLRQPLPEQEKQQQRRQPRRRSHGPQPLAPAPQP